MGAGLVDMLCVSITYLACFEVFIFARIIRFVVKHCICMRGQSSVQSPEVLCR